nr:MAG: hypothetical protein [Molluscum contagiosum virus]
MKPSKAGSSSCAGSGAPRSTSKKTRTTEYASSSRSVSKSVQQGCSRMYASSSSGAKASTKRGSSRRRQSAGTASVFSTKMTSFPSTARAI